MPRIAAEARSALVPLTGGGPKPPKGLNAEARAKWREIVGARPADFFTAGNLDLLALYCRTLVQYEAAMSHLETVPHGTRERVDAVAEVSKLNAAAVSLAVKLRLTIQSTLRPDSGKNDERSKPAEFLGGNVTRLRG